MHDPLQFPSLWMSSCPAHYLIFSAFVGKKPIELDNESKESTETLLDLHKDESPVTVAYKSVTPIVTTLPFLQANTSTLPFLGGLQTSLPSAAV